MLPRRRCRQQCKPLPKNCIKSRPMRGCRKCRVCVRRAKTPKRCPMIKCADPGCDNPKPTKNKDGCRGCPTCPCPVVKCPALVCKANQVLSELGQDNNGCMTCPHCEDCPIPGCILPTDCLKTSPGFLSNGCPGCPVCDLVCRPLACPVLGCAKRVRIIDANGCPECPRCLCPALDNCPEVPSSCLDVGVPIVDGCDQCPVCYTKDVEQKMEEI